jgi:hypothetical protein
MTRDRLRTDSVFLLVLVAAWFFALWLSISAIDAGAFDSVHALYANGVRCTYTNSPHWISWYSETIAVYAPVDFDTVRTQGPPECRYFMVDRRRSLTQSAQRFLEIRGEVADRGATHTLYRLRLD